MRATHDVDMERVLGLRTLIGVALAVVVGASCEQTGAGARSTTPPPPSPTAAQIAEPVTTTGATSPASESTAPATTAPAAVTTLPGPGPCPRPAGAPVARSILVERLPTDERVVALTIDVETDDGFVDSILDTLADRGVRATFGVTGAFARIYPMEVERIVAGGHHVMSHSDGHLSFTGRSSARQALTEAARERDLCASEVTLSALIGRSTMPFWRPPYGDHDVGVLDDAGAIGFGRTVLWTVDSLGWSGLDADAIVERVLSAAEPGAIVLLHAGSESQDGPALGRIIDGLRAEGYSFTTLAAGVPG